jgi:hypothetical protein
MREAARLWRRAPHPRAGPSQGSQGIHRRFYHPERQADEARRHHAIGRAFEGLIMALLQNPALPLALWRAAPTAFAHAIASDCTLVTADGRGFVRMHGLKMENRFNSFPLSQNRRQRGIRFFLA